MTSKAVSYANKYVKKTGNNDAAIHFGLDDANDFANECEVELIRQRPIFTEARKMLKGKLKVFTKIAMKVADEGKRRGFLVQYKL